MSFPYWPLLLAGLLTISAHTESFLWPDFRFNRVEDGQFSLRARCEFSADLLLLGEAGFSTGLERVSLSFKARQNRVWRAGTSFLEADLHRGSGSHYGSSTWPKWITTAQALLAERDYFDYYWNQGFAVTAGMNFRSGTVTPHLAGTMKTTRLSARRRTRIFSAVKTSCDPIQA
jgi:hypothetical protein